LPKRGIFRFGVGIGHWQLKIIAQNRTAADQDQKQQDLKLKNHVSIYDSRSGLLSCLLVAYPPHDCQSCLTWELINFDNKSR
jgi:hypothetical protein